MVGRSSLLVALTVAALTGSRALAQDANGGAEPRPVLRDHGGAPPPGSVAPSAAPGAKAQPGPAEKAPAPGPSDGSASIRVHEATELDEVQADADARYAEDARGRAPEAEELDPGGPDLDGRDLALREAREPRTPLADVELDGRLSWQRHGEIGASIVWVSRPFANALGETGTRYRPAVGLGLHLQWELVRWLQLRPYFMWSAHEVVLSPGALTTTSSRSIARDTVFEPIQASTFSAGVKLAPTWQLARRARAWLVAGIGYGRLGLHGVTFTEPGSQPVEMPNRDGVFVEFPVGLGAAYEILPGRAALVFEATGAPAVGNSGAAHDAAFQIVDPDGRLREMGGFGAFEATFAQSLGLAVLL